jgi:hypothetical protein
VAEVDYNQAIGRRRAARRRPVHQASYVADCISVAPASTTIVPYATYVLSFEDGNVVCEYVICSTIGDGERAHSCFG